MAGRGATASRPMRDRADASPTRPYLGPAIKVVKGEQLELNDGVDVSVGGLS